MTARIEGIEVPADGARLVGELYRPDSPSGFVVVPSHGYAQKREWMRKFARRCAERGSYVMNLDMRGHGDSTGEYDIERCAEDFITVANRAREMTSAEYLAIIGFSAFGYAALKSSVLDRVGLINYFGAIQPPNWPKEYEWRNYPAAMLATPGVIEHIRKNPRGKLMRFIHWLDKRFDADDRDPERVIFTIRNARTTDPIEFRKGSWGEGPVTDVVPQMNGSPYFLGTSKMDRHVSFRDAEKIAEAMKEAGKDVEVFEFENNFTSHDDFVPVADRFMDWVECKTNLPRAA